MPGRVLGEDEAARVIRQTRDMLCDNLATAPRLTCRKVWRVFPESPDGLREVLYLDGDNVPMTAYLRAGAVVSIADGW